MSLSVEEAMASVQGLTKIHEAMMAASAGARDLITVNHTLLELVERFIRQNCALENRKAAYGEAEKIAFHAVRIANAYLDAYDTLQNAVGDFTASLRENVGVLENDFLASVDPVGSA